MVPLTFNEGKVFVNSKEVVNPRLFWKPCSKTQENATLLCLANGTVSKKSVSWLLHPLYKKGDDNATCHATNSLFLPIVAAHQGKTPSFLFRHGSEEIYAHQELLVDFGRGKIYTKPSHVLVQRTGNTATFDAAFFWGAEYLETCHIERKYFQPFIKWFQELGCSILDTGTDPIAVVMIRDALLDLPLEEVIKLIQGETCDSESSEYVPSEESEIEYERTPRKRKRS